MHFHAADCQPGRLLVVLLLIFMPDVLPGYLIEIHNKTNSI
jgi:hypothetical protein